MQELLDRVGAIDNVQGSAHPCLGYRGGTRWSVGWFGNSFGVDLRDWSFVTKRCQVLCTRSKSGFATRTMMPSKQGMGTSESHRATFTNGIMSPSTSSDVETAMSMRTI